MPAHACIFCEIIAGRAPAHFVLEEPACVAFLDARPIFPGHVLVVPRAHHETLVDLPPDDVAILFGAARRICAAVERALGAEGTFVAMNNRISQSVPHAHVHVVPRRKGDGLRGFFWPRQKYASDAAAAEIAGRVREAVEHAA
ncbi:MAG TPA: HIT family protein [Polyangiaceae bacterium]|jgi:histidine triad (HIT) family protein